jgi:hypothetical protein
MTNKDKIFLLTTNLKSTSNTYSLKLKSSTYTNPSSISSTNLLLQRYIDHLDFTRRNIRPPNTLLFVPLVIRCTKKRWWKTRPSTLYIAIVPTRYRCDCNGTPIIFNDT